MSRIQTTPAPEAPPVTLEYGGYWTPASHGWVWVDADSASPTYVTGIVSDQYTFEQMTNPSVFPPGGSAIPGDDTPFRPNGEYTGQYWPNPDGTPGTLENPNYVPADINVPTVGIAPDMAPSITGHPFGIRTSGTEGTKPDGPAAEHYRVNTGSLRDAEIAVIGGPVEHAIISHDNARQMLATEGSWVFSFADQNVPDMTVLNKSTGQQEPKYQDQNPAASSQLRVYGEQVLNNVDQVLQLVGRYWRTVNDGAQYFAAADKASSVSD
jgi:hypothetical protein